MKVKKTVAALCLAAIMATSVGASAEGKFGFWQDRDPYTNEGGSEKWSHGVSGKTVYSYYQSPWSEKSYAMVLFNNNGACIDWKYNAQARAEGTAAYGISDHEEYWAPAIN